MENSPIKRRIYFVILGLSILMNVSMYNRLGLIGTDTSGRNVQRIIRYKTKYQIRYNDRKNESQNIKTDILSDWDMFTLALMKVESEYDSTAVSKVGAKGYFQITPVYIEEVNRVHKTHYKFNQVTDFNKAYEIFDLMQKAHNPEYDMDKALVLHNGNHKWYNRRVYKAMKDIIKYERMRSRIINVKS